MVDDKYEVDAETMTAARQNCIAACSILSRAKWTGQEHRVWKQKIKEGLDMLLVAQAVKSKSLYQCYLRCHYFRNRKKAGVRLDDAFQRLVGSLACVFEKFTR